MKFHGCSLDNFSATSADLTPNFGRSFSRVNSSGEWPQKFEGEFVFGNGIGNGLEALFSLILQNSGNTPKNPAQKACAKNLYQPLGTIDTVGRNPAPLDVWGYFTIYTLQGTNISFEQAILKMIFLFPRWDMLVPWRVVYRALYILSVFFFSPDFWSINSCWPLTWPWGCSGQWYPSGWTRACSSERHWGSTQSCYEATWM